MTPPLTCHNCGDLFTAPTRPCPHPTPGREYVTTGHGGHMFYPQPAPPAGHTRIPKERLQEIEAIVIEALNEPTGQRPPYGDTSGRFDLDHADFVLENVEHAAPSQEVQDSLFVNLRMARAEVALLRQAVATVPGLLTEIDRLRTECRRLQCSALEIMGVFTHEQIAQLMEVEPCQTPERGGLP